jgi:hypothetical protein
MSDIKLKPCPFCGSECVNDTSEPTGGEDRVFYWTCPCCVSSGAIGRSLLGATDGWNSRHDDTLTARVAELEAALKHISSLSGCQPCQYQDHIEDEISLVHDKAIEKIYELSTEALEAKL